MTIEPIKEKLDDKIAKLNSSRVYKKVTPRGDLSWYIKWASSITLIIAMMFTAVELFPINMFIANIGFIGWLIVGMLWHDRSPFGVIFLMTLLLFSLAILSSSFSLIGSIVISFFSLLYVDSLGILNTTHKNYHY